MDMDKIQFKTVGEFLDFVELYRTAVEYKQQSFQYKDNTFVTNYAKYVIEYIRLEIGVNAETIDNLLKHRAEARCNKQQTGGSTC